ncbi:MAG TPA: hypothetical protein VFK06_07055 [Candidatus Angelobacter sp.]|nr:hypothetical protein [Candidatus Angelobacter sp.]
MKRLLATLVLISASLLPLRAAGPSEFIYVESNIQSANGNSIFAFQRGSDGSFTQVPGSPFLSGGTGVQDRTFLFGPYDSDNNLVIDKGRQLLFAVNSGSDTIAVFNIKHDGSLKAIAGSPFPSGGSNPTSLAISGDILYVVNKNGDFIVQTGLQPNYTAMKINVDGSLTPVPNSTANVSYDSSPSQALVVPGTDIVFGNDFRGGLIENFKADPEGRLRAQAPTALPPNRDIPLLNVFGTVLRLGNLPLGLALHPKQPLLYVGFVGANLLGVYSYDTNGQLSFVTVSHNSGLAICWLRSNRAGTRLYTSNNGVEGIAATDPFSTVSVYDLSNPAAPNEIQNLQLAGMGNASQIELSNDERFVYLVGQRATTFIPEGQGNALHIFTVRPDGTLSEDHAPIQLAVPVGTQPQGIAVFSPQN